MYERDLPLKKAIRITRVRMFLLGHSFKEIDEMSVMDFGDYVGYMKEDNAADAKLDRDRQALRKKRNN